MPEAFRKAGERSSPRGLAEGEAIPLGITKIIASPTGWGFFFSNLIQTWYSKA